MDDNFFDHFSIEKKNLKYLCQKTEDNIDEDIIKDDNDDDNNTDEGVESIDNVDEDIENDTTLVNAPESSEQLSLIPSYNNDYNVNVNEDDIVSNTSIDCNELDFGDQQILFDIPNINRVILRVFNLMYN